MTTAQRSTQPRATAFEGRMVRGEIGTWFRVVGDLGAPGAIPLVVCHGGPGATHDYLTPLEALAGPHRPVVLYDQVGNGRSALTGTREPGFWTVEVFVEELAALVDHLEVTRFDLLGHSWGGQLGLESALRGVPGLRALVLAGTPASAPLWIDEARRQVAALLESLGFPPGVPEPGTAAYDALSDAYVRTHVYRGEQPPRVLVTSMSAVEENPEVYSAMVGPSEFLVTGSLREWDLSPRLGEIDLPTLVVAGEHDSATPRVVDQLVTGIPGARRAIIPGAGHMAHLERTDLFVRTVAQFLDQVGESED